MDHTILYYRRHLSFMIWYIVLQYSIVWLARNIAKYCNTLVLPCERYSVNQLLTAISGTLDIFQNKISSLKPVNISLKSALKKNYMLPIVKSSSCDGFCGFDGIVVENYNIKKKVV